MQRKHGTLVLALAMSALVADATAAPAAQLRSARHPVDGRYIVVLKPDAARAPGQASSRPDVITTALDLARTHGVIVDLAYEHALQGFSARATRQAIDRLLRDPRVDFVEEDGLVFARGTQYNATWGLDRSDQRDRPLDTAYTYDTTAGNVHAYIIDTGIRATHAEFGARVGAGFTAVGDGLGNGDCNGHGTHVAGTVGGTTWGMAKDVRLHPVRVLGCDGSGTTSGVIAGVDWVTAHHVKPAVANMSLGGGASTALDAAVASSINAGVVYAIAAGNDNLDACNDSPARVAAALTVGATGSNDGKASYSNWGGCLDLFAPGSSIASAWHTNDTASNTISGTSMAAPHVAGAAALYLAANPTASAGQVHAAIVNNATTGKVTWPGAGSPNRLLYSRFGVVDRPPAASFTVACAALSCTFDASASTDDRGIATYTWAFGDGTTGAGVRPSRTYAAAGSYTATLTVRDTIGQAASVSRSVSVTAGSTTTALQNGVAVTGLAAATGQSLYYSLAVPSGASQVRFEMYGGTGDADLYVKYGTPATTSSYDCRPYVGGNTETCSWVAPLAGTYYVMVRGYTTFSGVTLKGTYTTASAYFENAGNYAIADNATVESPIAVNRAGYAPSGLRVAVDIKHTYIGDLKVDLVAPDGSVYTLHNRTGAGTDNLVTTYAVNASTEAAGGTWRLRVGDYASGDTGYVDKWSLQF